ncbi:MAG TPA: hypothetical protein VFU76_10570 [Terriglobales bacterium]|nr:hypothetical protein [Terriglobales bacterium]
MGDAARRAGSLGDRPLVVLTAGRYTLPATLRWPKPPNFIKSGSTSLQASLARLSTRGRQIVVRVNQFARMAMEYGAREVASIAFARIGDNWEQSVWGTRAQFDMNRSCAGPPKPAAISSNAVPRK